MKKLINFYCFCSLVLFSALSFAFSGGTGTQDDPYQISSCSELQSINGSLSSSFILVNDLDCNGFDSGDGKGFMPLGSANYHFHGTLDGNNYTVFNLKINRPDLNNAGLIGYLGLTGTIKNISVVNGSVTGAGYSGGIVGYAQGNGNSSNGVITNLFYQGEVKGGGYLGGVIGYAYTRSVSHSSAIVNVTSSSNLVGGFAGYLSGAEIIDNHVVCTVVTTSSQGTSIGGFAGVHNGGPNQRFDQNFADCEVKGNVHVGGLIGTAQSSNITNSYALGQVTGIENVGGLIGHSSGGSNKVDNSFSAAKVSGTVYVGGLIGRTYEGQFTDSYWDKERSGQSFSAGGTPKTTAEMYQQATYVGWDFNSVWMIDENVNYPHFIIAVNEQAL
ncbi:MAG: GLUG motif-containing protein [Legionellales bacterium]